MMGRIDLRQSRKAVEREILAVAFDAIHGQDRLPRNSLINAPLRKLSLP